MQFIVEVMPVTAPEWTPLETLIGTVQIRCAGQTWCNRRIRKHVEVLRNTWQGKYIELLNYFPLSPPEYITDIITVKPKSHYSLRSNSELLLQKPRLKTLKTLGNRSFALAAPTLWNGLPVEIRHAESVSSFKRLLKTHLFRKAFC